MSKTERRYTSARERAEKQTSGFSATSLKIPEGATMFKPKEGAMTIDILPYKVGEGNPWAEEGQLHYERTYYTHRGIGANGDTYVCPRMTAKERCPICEHRAKLMRNGDSDDEQLIKDLAPKQRQLFNVINRKDPDKGVQIWDYSYHLFGKQLDGRLRNSEEDDGYEKFFFLEGGLSLRIGFSEESFGGHAYFETESIDFKQRSEDYDEDILDDVYNLDEMILIEDYESLKKIFLEAREEKGDDDSDDEKPRNKRRDSEEDDDEPKKKRHADDDDDQDEAPKKKKHVEEDEDDEPERKKKLAPSDEDDDWGDFEDKKSKKSDDDDDQDESPKKKKHVEEDEDERPAKKKRQDDDDENESEQPSDDDEDEKPKKKNRFSRDEDDKGWDNYDDEDAKPKKKKRKDDDD